MQSQKNFTLLFRIAWPLLAVQLMACTVGRSVLAPREDVSDASVAPEDVLDEAPPLDAEDVASTDVAKDTDEDGGDVASTDVTKDADEDSGDVANTDVADGSGCSSEQVRCGDACVNTQTDAMHCGACGVACTAGQSCVAGRCLTDCAAPNTACGDACVNTQTDAMHCGACGRACVAGQSCVAGHCVTDCMAPNTACGDACVSTQTDAMHCGTCGTRCVAPMGGSTACVGGMCRPTCPSGFTECSGVCVSTQTSTAHCGRCSNACATPANGTAVCTAGVCGVGTCNTGYGNCDMNAANGCETNVNTTVAHCGRCGNACATPANGTAACTAGVCGVGTCSTGYGNCDMNAANGCEAQFASNRAHCGRCGNACASGQDCVAGECVCPVGQTLCSGACVNLTSDSLHCGACGRACPAGQVCRTGTCQMTCASGSTLCGTQCVTLGDNVNHCGRCDNRCAADQTCASGVCVTVVTIDAIGCADGTREAFTDRTMYPNIAACAGAWRLPGIFPAIPASSAASCATLGNSSTTAPADGAGCSASNLCAPGWRICNGGDVLPRTRNMGCAAVSFPAGTFFAAAVSGTGCGVCALRTGTVTGPSCTSSSCTANCRESGDLNNDIFGCGTIGSSPSGACDGLDRFSNNDCGSLVAPWACGGGTMESRTVTKAGNAAGGVLCCRD